MGATKELANLLVDAGAGRLVVSFFPLLARAPPMVATHGKRNSGKANDKSSGKGKTRGKATHGVTNGTDLPGQPSDEPRKKWDSRSIVDIVSRQEDAKTAIKGGRKPGGTVADGEIVANEDLEAAEASEGRRVETIPAGMGAGSRTKHDEDDHGPPLPYGR